MTATSLSSSKLNVLGIPIFFWSMIGSAFAVECDCTVHTSSCQAQVQISDHQSNSDSYGNFTHKFQLSISVPGNACSDVSFQYDAKGANAVINAVPEYAVVFNGSFSKPVTVIGPWDSVSLPSSMTCNICREKAKPGDAPKSSSNGVGSGQQQPSASLMNEIDDIVNQSINSSNAMSAANPAPQLDPNAIAAAAQRAQQLSNQAIAEGNANAAMINALSQGLSAQSQQMPGLRKQGSQATNGSTPNGSANGAVQKCTPNSSFGAKNMPIALQYDCNFGYYGMH